MHKEQNKNSHKFVLSFVLLDLSLTMATPKGYSEDVLRALLASYVDLDKASILAWFVDTLDQHPAPRSLARSIAFLAIGSTPPTGVNPTTKNPTGLVAIDDPTTKVSSH